jgi:hypothetical protein
MAGSMTGGCMCGAIRYEISVDPVMSAHCYCRDCQKSTGGAMASVMVVPKAGFKLSKGELKFYAVKGDSGNEVARGFCPNCGTGVLSRLAGMPDVLAVKAGTLDDTSHFKATMNIYMKSAPAWAPVAPGLAKFDAMPG